MSGFKWRFVLISLWTINAYVHINQSKPTRVQLKMKDLFLYIFKINYLFVFFNKEMKSEKIFGVISYVFCYLAWCVTTPNLFATILQGE